MKAPIDPEYDLVTTYFNPSNQEKERKFFEMWNENKGNHLRPLPSRTFIIADGRSLIPFNHHSGILRYRCVELDGDLGSCGALLNGSKPYEFNGWAGTMLAGAMLCYCDCRDMIYAEQDCLVFGDVVSKLYEQLGDGGIIFGSYKEGERHIMPAAQSLFLVRHSFIPKFIRQFLSNGPQTQEQNLGEAIFARLETGQRDMWKRFTFGVDRGRPIPWDDPVWYAQKWTDEELAEAKKRGLI